MQLQQALDEEWETFCGSSAAASALAGWASEDERYNPFRDLVELRSYFEQRDDLDARDALLADLLRRSPDDRAAQRVMLAALRPGLVRLSRRASAFWDPEEAESAVVAAALDRLSSRTIKFPSHPASGVLGSVWRSVWQRRLRERCEEDYWGRRADADALDQVEAQRHDTPIHRVLEVIEESVRCGAVPVRGARLLVLNLIHGYSNNEIAELDGLRPCTIRKHRRDAELRLADFVG